MGGGWSGAHPSTWLGAGFTGGAWSVGAVVEATLRARHADVRSGRPCEARPPMPRVPVALLGAEGVTGIGGSENTQILIWGMGGAAAGLPIVTAARRARAGAESTAPTDLQ